MRCIRVSPLGGEWIEICFTRESIGIFSSRLSEASGLKLRGILLEEGGASVSPLRGEWIEIPMPTSSRVLFPVSPLRGEWIEIALKFHPVPKTFVSPLRGEWIEICYDRVHSTVQQSRLSEASGLKYSMGFIGKPLLRLASQRRVD